MRTLLTSVAVVASLLASTIANATPNELTDKTANTGYVYLATLTSTFDAVCSDSYAPVRGSLTKVQDKLGAPDNIAAATKAALGLFFDRNDYQRSDLIPEVTRMVKTALNKLNVEVGRSKKKFCATYSKNLLDAGLVVAK